MKHDFLGGQLMYKGTVLIITLCIALFFVSCSDNTAKEITNSLTTTPTVQTNNNKNGAVLEVEKGNYDGQNITILSSEHARYEFDAETQTGEVVNDAVYERNLTVEDYLDIDFKYVYQPGHWPNRDTFTQTIANAILADDNAFDLVSNAVVIIMPVTSEGYFIDGKDLPYMDLAKPWWIAGMYEKFSINNILYGFIGDATLSMYKDLSVVFFNKNMFESYNLDNPYDLVRTNKWILDKFIELGLSVSDDLNGDGKIDYKNDVLGCLSEAVPNGTFQTALECGIVGYDENKLPYFTGLSERYINAYEKLYDFYCLNDNTYVLSTIDDQTYTTMKTFNEGRVLLMCNFVYSTEHLRAMEDDYGIIPYPKYDTDQQNYLSQLGTSTSMLFVPINTADTELTSKVMECLAFYGYKLVSPRYFEIALKEKYARDEDMKEMLDIIRQGATIDFQFVYGTTIGATPNDFRFSNPSPAISKDAMSRYTSVADEWTSNLEKLKDAYIS
jgi:hypothetical protein